MGLGFHGQEVVASSQEGSQMSPGTFRCGVEPWHGRHGKVEAATLATVAQCPELI